MRYTIRCYQISMAVKSYKHVTAFYSSLCYQIPVLCKKVMDAVECKHTEHWTQRIQQMRLGEWMFSMRINVADKNKTLITANENFISCVFCVCVVQFIVATANMKSMRLSLFHSSTRSRNDKQRHKYIGLCGVFSSPTYTLTKQLDNIYICI